MSTTIDQRVVEMRFDNKQFESNVSTTMSTLEKLKSKLDFTNSAKGLDNLLNSTKKIDFSGLSAGIEVVQAKFSALEVIGVTALANITNSAVNAGKKMLNSLTIEPVTTGFNEYELKMGSVQTIMASTGESLEVVNKYLEELNAYSDKTIYSFSDMTQNIGKFTNAGVKLKDAVKAIQGVSNVAAISGANANEASRAMYNFAQALSAGSVKLIDWKSIENANMATVQFKEELMKTAVEMGTLVKVGDKYRTMTVDANGKVSDLFTSTTGFNEALSNQWMTTDVLVETLNRYADETTDIGKRATQAATEVKTFSQMMDSLKEAAQSGWAASWELIFGDFNEAKQLWTDIYNVVGSVIDASSNARNAIIKEWKDFGGRTYMIESVSNAFKALGNILKTVKEAFRTVFPKMSGQQLALLTKRIAKVTQGFAELTERNMPKTKKVFEAFFTVVKAITTILGGAFSIAMKAAVVVVTILTQIVFDAAEGMADVILGIKKWIKENDILNKSLKVIVGIIAIFIKSVINVASSIVSGISDAIRIISSLVHEFMQLEIVQRILHGFTNVVYVVIKSIKTFVLNGIYIIKEFVNTIRGLDDISLENVSDIFKDFVEKIKEHFKGVDEVFENITDATDEFKTTVQDSFNTTGKTVEGLQGKFQTFAKVVSGALYSIGPAEVFAVGFGVAMVWFLRKINIAINNVTKPISSFAGVLGSLSQVLKAFAFSVKASALTSAALAIAILAGSIIMLAKTVDRADMGIAALALIALGGALAVFTKYVSSFGNIDKFVVTMLSFSGGLLILTACMKVIESIDTAKLAQSFLYLVGIMLTMGAFAVALATYEHALYENSLFLVSFALAMLILTYSIERFTGVDAEAIKANLETIGTIMVALGSISWLLGNLKFGSAVGMLVVSAGLIAFLEALRYICNFDLNIILSSLGNLAVVVLTFIALMMATEKAGQYAAGAGIALIGMGVAMRLMLTTLETLVGYDLFSMLKAVAGMGILMKAMSVVIKSTCDAGEHAAKAGMMLIQMAGAMVILTAVIAILSHVDLFGIIKALVAIVVITEAMSVLIKSTEKATKANSTLIILAATIAGMVAAIGMLAMIDADKLALATGAVAGIGVVFSLMIKALESINDAGKYFKNAVAGLGTMVIISGLMVILLLALDRLDVSASIETVGSICLLLLSMAAATKIMSSLSPFAVSGLAGIQSLLSALAPVGVVITVLGGILYLMGKYLPEGTEAALERGFSIMQTFVNGIVETVAGIFTTALTSLTGSLATVGEDLSSFMENMSGFIEGVKKIDDSALAGAGYLCGVLLKLTGTGFIQSIFGFKDSIDSLNEANFGGIDSAVDSIIKLGEASPKMQKLLDWFNSNNLIAFGSKLTSFGESLVEYANAISGYPDSAKATTENIAETISTLQNGVSSGKRLFTEDVNLSTFGQELADFGSYLKTFYGHVSVINTRQLGNVMTGIDQIAQSVKNIGDVDSSTMSSFRSVFANMGENAIQAFTEVFKNAGPRVREAVNHLVGSISSGISGNATLIKASGQAVIANMIIGIEEMKPKAADAGHKIARAAYFETTKLYNEFYESGRYLILGLVNGVNSRKKLAEKAAEKIAQSMLDSVNDTLEIHSPSVQGEWSGTNYIQGIINGVVNKMAELKTTVVNGVKENMLAPMDNIKAYVQQVSAEATESFGDSFFSNIIDPAKKYVPELETMFGDISVEFDDSSIKNVLDVVDVPGVTSGMSDFNDMLSSATSGLGGLGKSAGSSASGVNSLAKSLSKATKKKKEYVEKTYEATNALERYMERLYKESDQYKTDTETLEGYRAELEELKMERDSVQKQLEENTAGRIKLSEEEREAVESDLEELENSIESKNEDIASHLEKMCDNARSLYNNLRDDIKKSFEDALDFSKLEVDPGIDLFKEFKLDEEVTSESILDNMKSQVKGVEEWMKNLEKLSQKESLSAGLLEQLKEMGVSGASYVKAFAKMSNSELKKASQYFDDSGVIMGQNLLNGMKSAFSDIESWKQGITSLLTTGLDQRIVEKLAEMGMSSKEYIDAFLTMNPEDIEEFNKMFIDSLTVPDNAADDIMKSFVDTWDKAVNAAMGTDEESKESVINGVISIIKKMMEAMKQGIDDNKDNLFDKASTVSSDTLGKFEKYLNHRKGSDIGDDITSGLKSGILDGKSGVINAAVEVALAAYKAAKAALDINSPSGMFEALGRWSDLGMIKGFIGLADKVKMAAVSVGLDAFDGMKKSLRNIATAVDGEFDITPTISPVVDLTNVENSADIIRDIFSTQHTAELAIANQKSINDALSAKHAANESNLNPNRETIINKFEQHNHSPKALSRAEIYRQTKNLFSAAKGTVDGV